MDDSQKIKPGRPPRQKITEIETETVKSEFLDQEPLNRDEHLVIINGKERRISRMTFDVLRKSPDIMIEIPKGTNLAEPKVTPCKDC